VPVWRRRLAGVGILYRGGRMEKGTGVNISILFGVAFGIVGAL
jgi:hypothetical protein